VLYRMCLNLWPVLQDLVPEVFLSLKYHIPLGLICNGCGAPSIYRKFTEVEEKAGHCVLIETSYSFWSQLCT
jgi:hypothetical protein